MAHDPRKIRPDEARAKGVSTEHNEMPTGELRFRLKHDDGTAYIRTEATDRGGWQNSHYHRTVRETYIVQRGKMAFAELVDGALQVAHLWTERDLHHRAERFAQCLSVLQFSDPHRQARRGRRSRRLARKPDAR